MRDGLKPEVRVNKNGVPVTKHVRDSSAPARRNRLLAAIAPSLDQRLAEKAERRAPLKDFSKTMDHWLRLSGKWGDGRDQERIQSRCEELGKYSLENLRYVTGLCDAGSQWEELNAVMTLIDNRAGSEEWTVTGLRYRCLLGNADDASSFFSRLDIVERYFTDDTYISPAEENTEEFYSNMRIVRFALRAKENLMKGNAGVEIDFDNPKWADPITTDLVKVLRDHPFRDAEIIGFMNDRKLAPYMVSEEMLRSYLEAPSKPLRDGAL